MGCFFDDGNFIQIPANGAQSIATNSGDVTILDKNANNCAVSSQNTLGGTNTHESRESVTELKEMVSTLTKELERTQQQQNNLIEVVTTSQKQIQQMTDIIDRLIK